MFNYLIKMAFANVFKNSLLHAITLISFGSEFNHTLDSLTVQSLNGSSFKQFFVR